MGILWAHTGAIGCIALKLGYMCMAGCGVSPQDVKSKVIIVYVYPYVGVSFHLTMFYVWSKC